MQVYQQDTINVQNIFSA